MSSQTFYLKYRPQTLSQLDNVSVAEKLSAYLKTGNVPHAFLLVGHKGTGKTSSARLIAKAINCENNVFSQGEKTEHRTKNIEHSEKRKDSRLRGNDSEEFEPCNKCEICKLITEGNDPDVLEIDAASNTSVDDIRDLRDKVRFSPTISRYKVYIIDEVHMISKSAFNALLKTLEEPPEMTVFVLATTEFEKVPETITSRCTVIEFKRADADSIKKSIGRIVKGEKLKITLEATDSIIAISSGSFRDAAKILEQAVYLSEGKEITAEIIKKITGGESVDQVYELLEIISDEKNVKKTIQLIENLKEKSVDLRMFVKQILEVLHEMLLVQVGIENAEHRIQNLARNIESERLKIIIEQFEKAYMQMKFADVAELPVELAILEIMNRELASRSPSVEAGRSGHRTENLEHSESTLSDNADFWKKLISRVNVESKQLAGIMRSCKFSQKSESEFQIETTSKFHYDRLIDAKAKDLINNLACEVAARDVKIKYILKQ